MFREMDGHVAQHGKATGDINLRLHQGKNLGERVHTLPRGKGLMFISRNVEPATREAAVAALDALRAELEARGVAVKEGSWRYRVPVVDDPDGNQLFFNYPAGEGA
jgi:hypothetical protein